MADDGLAGVNQMVSSLNASIKAAVERTKAQATESTDAQEFRKDVKKSPINTAGFATDIGVLAKNTTRLNVVSNLGPDDPADFYKFRVTTKGEPTLGKLGDDGVRLQVMTKLGVVVADSNQDAGDKFDNFDKMQKGELTLDRGDYTLRLTREKGEKASEPKNYAIQLSMGSYKQDFDTVAKQPAKGDSPFTMSGAQQAMLSGLTDALSNMQSMPTGQTGSQKLMGSFDLFV